QEHRIELDAGGFKLPGGALEGAGERVCRIGLGGLVGAASARGIDAREGLGGAQHVTDAALRRFEPAPERPGGARGGTVEDAAGRCAFILLLACLERLVRNAERDLANAGEWRSGEGEGFAVVVETVADEGRTQGLRGEVRSGGAQRARGEQRRR